MSVYKSNLLVILAIVAMGLVIVVSNILVNYQVQGQIGDFKPGDLLTYGAFTFPIAFLITDLTNRAFGVARARVLVSISFIVAIICSITIPDILVENGWLDPEAGLSPDRIVRVAVASGSAFLIAQMIDIFVFDRLRAQRWWKAPVASSIIGSVLDTVIFFTLAFSSAFVFLGANMDWSLAPAPFLLIFDFEVATWINLAVGDLIVKLVVAMLLLLPYRFLRARTDKGLVAA